MTMKVVKVGRSHHALIDDEDLALVERFKWWISSDGYAHTHLRNANGYVGTIRMHRLIAGTPPSKITDHINHNRLDNRRANLRICDQSVNVLNCLPRSTNKTGTVGVSWDSRRSRWRSCLTVKGRLHNRYFIEIEDAIKNRKQYEVEYL